MATFSASRGSDRNYFRLAVNIAIAIETDQATAPAPATLVDISEGGCKIASKSMLLRGAEVAFEVPRTGKATLKLRGIVRHIDFKPSTRTFDYGLEYSGLRPADQDAIYQFVVEEQRRRLQASAGLDSASARTGKVQDRQQAVLRVERKFPIQYSISGTRLWTPAIALDISRGGMRIVLDREMPEGRAVELRFTLPGDVLDVLTRREHSRDGSIFGREIEVKERKARPFEELRVSVKLLPGRHELGGAYHYSVSFLRPKPEFLEEIERFLHAAQLTEIRKKRAPAKTKYR